MSTQLKSLPPPGTSMALGLEASGASRRTTTPVLQAMAGVSDPAARAPGPHRNLIMDLPHQLLLQLRGLRPGAQVPELLRVRGTRQGRLSQVNVLLRMSKGESLSLPPMGQCLVPPNSRKVPQIRIRGQEGVSTRKPTHPLLCVAIAKQRIPHFGGGIRKDNLCVTRAAYSMSVSFAVQARERKFRR